MCIRHTINGSFRLSCIKIFFIFLIQESIGHSSQIDSTFGRSSIRRNSSGTLFLIVINSTRYPVNLPGFYFFNTTRWWFFSPSSNEVFASNPNSCFAPLTSRHRRGWPSGLLVSHLISPSNPVSWPISVTSSLMEISRQHRYSLGQARCIFPLPAQSSTQRNSREAAPVPHTTYLGSCSFASTNFLMRAGMTWDLSGLKLSRGPYRFTGRR